ncbi:hypothetical protein M6B38_352800 [Iris pallida]|uniref:Uncharacterized protein n=1 Tax=Iris pallida TaxID=29817 RepID=A0AAX6GQG2_IRIPA|nr:hypothetical protein M6B38_352800 [Iris pallida]
MPEAKERKCEVHLSPHSIFPSVPKQPHALSLHQSQGHLPSSSSPILHPLPNPTSPLLSFPLPSHSHTQPTATIRGSPNPKLLLPLSSARKPSFRFILQHHLFTLRSIKP